MCCDAVNIASWNNLTPLPPSLQRKGEKGSRCGRRSVDCDSQSLPYKGRGRRNLAIRLVPHPQMHETSPLLVGEGLGVRLKACPPSLQRKGEKESRHSPYATPADA